jgi:hypothetical protein
MAKQLTIDDDTTAEEIMNQLEELGRQPEQSAPSVSDLPERVQAMAGYMVGRLMLAGVIRFDDAKTEATTWQNAMTTLADCLELWPDNGDWPVLP